MIVCQVETIPKVSWRVYDLAGFSLRAVLAVAIAIGNMNSLPL